MLNIKDAWLKEWVTDQGVDHRLRLSYTPLTISATALHHLSGTRLTSSSSAPVRSTS
ncbi:hypothetical protein JK386_12725 [Nocardioides sp. zg-536]|uniref:Uncharacterized protein n=1 Tax=Nocardioides faecalis TaxID=2803858 RepID=A0A938Y7R9_9ACTN|nr:hypothetical protein [Nocardioides faecalis]MBM9460769.1 hypothetical protein [Nocardioides faecalis]QVI57962.1 hypothetical protein KG111_13100 [Nocardioides faecalis]